MKVIAMIPARYSASRFPGKLMQDLAGKSVILRTYEATIKTNLFSASCQPFELLHIFFHDFRVDICKCLIPSIFKI